MNPQQGKWCAIVGAAGALGHLAIQYAKVMGLRVAAIDGAASDKKQLCLELGADAYFDFGSENLVNNICAKTGGGADYILVLSAHQACYE